MANLLNSMPWTIDTPGASVLYKTPIKVAHFEFSLYAAQGNEVIVQDQTGKQVWSATGAADLEEVRSAKVGWINGLIVPTLQGGGVLTIYIE